MIHIELKPYLDRDEEIVDRIIDASLTPGWKKRPCSPPSSTAPSAG